MPRVSLCLRTGSHHACPCSAAPEVAELPAPPAEASVPRHSRQGLMMSDVFILAASVGKGRRRVVSTYFPGRQRGDGPCNLPLLRDGPGLVGSGDRFVEGVCSGWLHASQTDFFPGSLPFLVSLTGSLWSGPVGNQERSSSFLSPPALRCPGCPRRPRWPSPARGSSSWQSPGLRPPCWQSGTPYRNPSHMCLTTTGSFTWPVSGSCGLPHWTRAGWAPAGGLDVGPTPAGITLRTPFISLRSADLLSGPGGQVALCRPGGRVAAGGLCCRSVSPSRTVGAEEKGGAGPGTRCKGSSEVAT